MKPLKSILLGIAALMASCASDDAGLLMPEPDNTPQPSVSRFRSVDEARNVAQQAIAALDNKSRASRTIKDNGGVTVVRSHESRSGDSDTLMYAIDLDDNQGFVLIAGPADMSPLLAVIESGSYNDPENLKNESYQLVLNETKAIIAQSIDGTRNPSLPIDPTPAFYTVVDSVNYKYEPTVKFNWNQGWPENMFVENKVAGCVPLATVTAMAVVEYPKSMTYTFPERDIASESIDWATIKKHASSLGENPSDESISNHYKTCGAPEAAHKTLARLIRQAGYICGAFDVFDGKYHSTSVYRQNVFAAIKKYLPSTMYLESDPATSIFQNLQQYKVALIDYYTETSGHTWIADGVWRLGMKKSYYEIVPVAPGEPTPSKPQYILTKTEGSIDELVHFNWGWGGNCNGWFRYLSTYNPTNPYQYDYPFNYTNSVEYKLLGHYMCVGKR